MGTLSLAAPLVLFERSRLWVGTGFHLLPSFYRHHPTQHNYTTQTVIHTVTLIPRAALTGYARCIYMTSGMKTLRTIGNPWLGLQESTRGYIDGLWGGAWFFSWWVRNQRSGNGPKPLSLSNRSMREPLPRWDRYLGTVRHWLRTGKHFAAFLNLILYLYIQYRYI